MTQRDRILYELRQAGEAGVRSDTFFRLSMPRAAARIQELRDSGHDITSEREGKFCRYTLVGNDTGNGRVGAHSRLSGNSLVSGVGVGADRHTRASSPGSRPGHSPPASVDPARLFADEEGKKTPSAYDPWDQAA